MNDQRIDIEEEKPLDPAAERLRRKMLRLMVISLGSMFIGIFAVLFAIVYKMNNASVVSEQIEAVIELPAGFKIVETQLSDGVILLRGQDSDGLSKIMLFDPASGAPLGSIELKSQ